MKSFKYLQGKKDFDLIVREKPTPQPTGNQVLVRVAACGVCGTDIHILDRFSEYTALGHEIAATVEEIGDSVTKIQVGDAVVVEDVTFCGSCESCKNGRTDLCRNMYSLQGQSGMGEYLLVHENMLIPAAGVDPVAATLTEPLAVAINTFFATHLPAEGNLVIFGLGIQGILCAALARHYGAGTV
ncbi:MAG: alcohol dehydrogenase catalytic domain-containing protein, partial [Clostridia bacterium]|nr:alcohol dehydrogenase catalytic domain-containing protein [Clostridia bacterium]